MATDYGRLTLLSCLPLDNMHCELKGLITKYDATESRTNPKKVNKNIISLQ